MNATPISSHVPSAVRALKGYFVACVGGLLVWIVAVTVIDHILRFGIANYSAAERTLQFTLPMMYARLTMAVVASLLAGALTRWISPSSRWAATLVGAVIFGAFVPLHVSIWTRLPVWYHLAFLLTIVPGVLVGALLPQMVRSKS